MAKSNRQLLITLGADTTTFSQKVKRAKDLTKELDSNFKLLSSSSKNFDKSLDGLAKKQDYLNDRIKVSTTLNDVYNDRLKEQQELLKNSQQAVQKLSKEVDGQVKELEEVRDMCEKGSKEWKDWQKEIDAVRDELSQNEKECKKYQDRVIALNTAINKNQTEIQKMNGELAETKIKFQMLSRDKTFEEMQKDISETEREFNNIKNSTDGFGRAVSDLKAEKAHLNTQMKKTNNLMEEYARDISKSTAEMKKLESEVQDLTYDYNTMKKAVDSMDGTEENYKKMADELDRLGSELTSANNLMNIHKNRVEKLTVSYKQSENSVKSMEGAIKRVDNEIYNFGRQNNFKSIETHMESLRHEFEMLGSRMDLLKSKYINFESSVSGAVKESKLLKQQTKILREEFKAQESAMNEYKLKIKDLISEKTKLTDKIKKLKNELEGVDDKSPKFIETNAKLGELERNLEKVEDEMDDVNQKLRQMELDSNSTLTNINNNIQGQGRVWDALSGRIKTVGGAITTVGNSMQSLGGALMPVTAGVTALGGAVIKTGMDFQEGMDKAQSVMGATNAETEEMIVKARELASQSRWTATDVSNAYGYMGMAGWNASQSMKGIKGVLDLATAGATDLATTSDIVTDGLTAMGLEAKDTEMFVNAMSATMVGSNTNIEMMGETLKYAGNVAGGLGITMQDLSLAIGTMANAGIKASMSGTAIRGGLTRLIAPTEKAEIQMKKYGIEVKKTDEGNVDLRATMENLRSTMGKLDKDTQNAVAKVIFGQTAMNGWLSIINADADAFNELAKEIDNATVEGSKFTELLAEQMNDNLAGDLRTLRSTLEESFLTIFDEIEPYLRGMVDKITTTIRNLTEKFKGLDDETQKNIVKFVAFAGVIAPLVSVFGFLLSGIGTTVTALGSLVGVSGKVITKFNFLKGSGATLKGLFTNFGGTMKTLAGTMKGNLSGALSSVTKLFGGGAGLSGVMTTLSSVALPALAVALGGLGVIFGDNEQALSSLIDKFGWFGQALSGVSEFLNGAWKGTFGQIGNFLGGIGDSAKAIFTGNFKDIGDIWSETWSEMKSDAGSAWENITMTSTRSISKLRNYTEKDVAQIKTIFEDTYGQISQVTSTNLENVAQNITDMFTDHRGKSLALSSETIDILRGTSDTMRVLFSGVKAEMDIDVAKARFTENLNNLLNTGGTTAEQLAKDFETAWSTIDTNIIDGGQRLNSNAEKVLGEFSEVASGKIDQGVDDIVSILDELDTRGIESLRGIGTNWNTIFQGISTDSKMTTEEMKSAILANIESLGLDTPEKLQAFRDTLKYELNIAKQESGEEGQGIGSEILEGVETGVNEGVESTGENIKNATKNVTEKATTGAKEGFEQLPESVRQELEKAGVSINEQGNIIVQDMASKGKQGAKAYVDEMNSQLPKLSGVAGTIKQQLDGINKVRFGGVTKQLSEINKWLGTTKDSAVKTGASLAQITTVTFGKTTKGLSEIDKWLKDHVTKDAGKTKTALKNITTVTFGATTKGLSEVTKWLRDNVTPKANSAKTSLQNLANVRFGGVTSSLSSVVSMLDRIANKAKTTKSAINRVINSKEKSMAQPVEYQIQSVPSVAEVSAEISRFKTSGGFYNPQSITTSSASRSATETNSNDDLLKAMLKQNQLLLQLLNTHAPIEVAVNMDGKQIARASAKYIDNELKNITKRNNRLGGIM